MKLRFLPIIALVFVVFRLPLHAAEANWAGEYADKKFLNGKATFQLSIEQQGSAVQVSFDAVNNNGQGCAPEAQTSAKATGTGTLQFSFQDNKGNAGTGVISRSGDDLVVSLKPTRVKNRDCVAFYRENIRLKRVGK